MPGTPLCGHCALRENVGLRGMLLHAQAKCAACGGPTRNVVAAVAPSQHVVLPEGTGRRAIDHCACGHDRASHMDSGRGQCLPFGMATSVATACACTSWVPVGAPLEGAGQPFGVEIAKDGNLWNCQVRDAAGMVAYVRVGEPTADAARWAALSHLRGYARDVASADAEALRAAFSAESLKIEPPAAAPAPEIDPRDPLAVLMAAKMREPLRDRLLAELEARERRWNDLAEDEDADAYTVALAKDAADYDAAALLRLVVGE